MVAYKTAGHKAKDMRYLSTSGQYQNRLFERACGGPVETFKTILQLLSAIRDAIAGDDVRILYRDISSHNVSLRREGAPEGRRRVLIDLDMVLRAADAQPIVRADHNVGTHTFQSLSVLDSHDDL